ncbi:thioesterase family protein [uncultured Demequina sp.]|uniref:acyl-CoA thioesterase n=1 Tax=uncultured Demequina sp. TaxID=693499 RepID=UPI0025FF5779|nr:thioesterase family protein [uncultured Demequina sp.]
MSRIHVPISLRWSDLDAYGHVNNTAMLRLLEEARISVFWADADNESSTAVLAAGPGAPTTTIIAGQRIEYLAQVPYLRRPLDVQLWIGSLGGASIEICYEVCSPVGSEEPVVFARAATTLVLMDPETQRPRRISATERAAWEPHMDEPVQFRR